MPPCKFIGTKGKSSTPTELAISEFPCASVSKREICMKMKLHIGLILIYTLRLVLKQTHKRTRKWPVGCYTKMTADSYFRTPIWLRGSAIVLHIERFSFECQKVIGFELSTPHYWLKKLAPIFHPIRSKTKTNRDSRACVFPRFASATCNYFEFWLVHCIVCVLCDWLE